MVLSGSALNIPANEWNTARRASAARKRREINLGAASGVHRFSPHTILIRASRSARIYGDYRSTWFLLTGDEQENTAASIRTPYTDPVDAQPVKYYRDVRYNAPRLFPLYDPCSGVYEFPAVAAGYVPAVYYRILVSVDPQKYLLDTTADGFVPYTTPYSTGDGLTRELYVNMTPFFAARGFVSGGGRFVMENFVSGNNYLIDAGGAASFPITIRDSYKTNFDVGPNGLILVRPPRPNKYPWDTTYTSLGCLTTPSTGGTLVPIRLRPSFDPYHLYEFDETGELVEGIESDGGEPKLLWRESGDFTNPYKRPATSYIGFISADRWRQEAISWFNDYSEEIELGLVREINIEELNRVDDDLYYYGYPVELPFIQPYRKIKDLSGSDSYEDVYIDKGLLVKPETPLLPRHIPITRPPRGPYSPASVGLRISGGLWPSDKFYAMQAIDLIWMNETITTYFMLPGGGAEHNVMAWERESWSYAVSEGTMTKKAVINGRSPYILPSNFDAHADREVEVFTTPHWSLDWVEDDEYLEFAKEIINA